MTSKKFGIALILCSLPLAACQRDKISVYNAPKEAPPSAMPMGNMAMPPASVDAPSSMPMSVGADANGPELPPGHPPVDGSQSAQLPPGHPPINGSNASSGMDMGMGGGPAMSGASNPGVHWNVPKGWTEKPASQMRVGSFSATGKNGQSVDISVVTLGGEAGGDLSNVNRWRGQIELPPISESDLPKQTEKISPAGRQMLFVDIVGEKPVIDNKYKKRLVAAIYVRDGQSWFFKMMGEDSAVKENKPAFMKFLESLDFH